MRVATARSGVSSAHRLAYISRSNWAGGPRGLYRYRPLKAGGTTFIGAVAVSTAQLLPTATGAVGL
jgi:hypothetical protein